MNKAASESIIRVFKINDQVVRHSLVSSLIAEENLVQILKAKRAQSFIENLISSLVSQPETKDAIVRQIRRILDDPKFDIDNKESFYSILQPYLNSTLVQNME